MRQNSIFTRLIKTESGIGKITLLVFGSIFAAVSYAVYEIAPFYYYFYEIENQMHTVTRIASSETDEEIRKRLWYHVMRLQLPVEPEDLIIERHDDHMIISLPYQEVFYITWDGKDYDLWTFKFHAYVDDKF